MVYKTLSELRTEVQDDLDLGDEDFISADEIDANIRKAVKEIEAVIHDIYEDYFLTKGNLALVSGQTDISMPSDIYSNKIRRIIYSNGATQYEIKRLKDRDGFMEQTILYQFPSTNFYKYRLVNASATAGVKIQIAPQAQETSSTNVTIWYLREANTLTSDSDKCDIPEFYPLVLQNAKCYCLAKEPGHPNYPSALGERERLMGLMQSTLQSMVPDGDNEIEMDYTFYEDMS